VRPRLATSWRATSPTSTPCYSAASTSSLWWSTPPGGCGCPGSPPARTAAKRRTSRRRRLHRARACDLNTASAGPALAWSGRTQQSPQTGLVRGCADTRPSCQAIPGWRPYGRGWTGPGGLVCLGAGLAATRVRGRVSGPSPPASRAVSRSGNPEIPAGGYGEGTMTARAPGSSRLGRRPPSSNWWNGRRRWRAGPTMGGEPGHRDTFAGRVRDVRQQSNRRSRCSA
jgi:hypothetical protein